MYPQLPVWKGQSSNLSIEPIILCGSFIHNHVYLNPKTLARKVNSSSASSMADSVISVEKLKSFWHSQVHDEEKWALNVKLLRAAGLFVGSVFLMRNYGDHMGI